MTPLRVPTASVVRSLSRYMQLIPSSGLPSAPMTIDFFGSKHRPLLTEFGVVCYVSDLPQPDVSRFHLSFGVLTVGHQYTTLHLAAALDQKCGVGMWSPLPNNLIGEDEHGVGVRRILENVQSKLPAKGTLGRLLGYL